MDKIELLLLGLIGVIIIFLCLSQIQEWQSTGSDDQQSQTSNQDMPSGGIPGLIPEPRGGTGLRGGPGPGGGP